MAIDGRNVLSIGVGSEVEREERTQFEGVLQILRFNYPMFVGAGLLLVAGAAVLEFLPVSWPVRYGLILLMVLGLAWTLTTLAVSHYVYDGYAIFKLWWLPQRLSSEVRQWANIHAGFDQASIPLQKAFPLARGTPVDLFDPAVMTERSIHRARAYYPAIPGTLPGAFDHLPLEEGSLDAVFMLFAAHELRRRDQRAALFTEAARALRKGGALLLVEHLRGPANALAFGPGVFHFHSRREWLRAGQTAGLLLTEEFQLTPFATGLIWRKRK